MKKIESGSKLWGELEKELKDEGYDMDSLQAAESVTKHDLTNKEGVLPQGNFIVFLRPKKTKSGLDAKGKGYKQLFAMVEENKDVPGFMDHVNSEGDHTSIPTSKLRQLLIDWEPKKAPSKPKAQKAEQADEVEEVGAENAIEAVTNESRVTAIENILEEIEANTESEDVKERVSYVQDELEALKVAISEDVPEPEETEEERLEREERERVEAEAQSFLDSL